MLEVDANKNRIRRICTVPTAQGKTGEGKAQEKRRNKQTRQEPI
jgi:hypothetical protein